MKNKTTVFLIRHGEIHNPNKVLYGSNIEMHLSDVGKKQLSDLAKTLQKSGYTIEKIFTSPLPRARESSEIIARTFAIPQHEIVVKDQLTDVSIPALAGKPLAVREEIHAKGTDEYDDGFVHQGNESRETVVRRMEQGFQEAVQEGDGKTIAIVSHGDPLRFLIYRLLNPGEKVPPMCQLAQHDYPQKGQAYLLQFNDEGNVVGYEIIEGGI